MMAILNNNNNNNANIIKLLHVLSLYIYIYIYVDFTWFIPFKCKFVDQVEVILS